MIVELRSDAVSDLLPPVSEELVTVDEPVAIGGVTHHISATFDFMPGQLSVQFVPATNEVTVSVPFDVNITAHNLGQYVPGLDPSLGFPGWQLQITHAVTVFTDDVNAPRLGMDFRAGIDPAHIDVDTANAFGDFSPFVESVAATQLATHLEQNVRYLGAELAFALRVGDDDPWTLESIDVRVVSPDSIALLLMTGPGRTGNPAGYAIPQLSPSENVVVLTSNRWLLEDVICPQIADLFRLEVEEVEEGEEAEPLFTYNEGDAECVLTSPQSIAHLVPYDVFERVRLTELRLYVGAGYIGVEGAALADNDFCSLSASFEARAYIRMTDEGIEIRPDIRQVKATGRVVGWINVLFGLAMIVSPLLRALILVLSPLAATLADQLTAAISGALAEMEEPIRGGALPLPIHVTRTILDQLVFGGRLALPEVPPPVPSVEIVGNMEVSSTSFSDPHEHHSFGLEDCFVWSVNVAQSHHGIFVAETRLMVFPIDYEWRLGRHLLQGSGTVEMGGVPVRYEVDGRQCQLWLETGDSLDARLFVTATDCKGISDSDTVWIQVQGRDTMAGSVGAWIFHGPSGMDMWAIKRLDDLNKMIAWKPLPCTWPDVAVSYSTAISKGMGVDIQPSDFDFFDRASEPIDWRFARTQGLDTVYSTGADASLRINALASLHKMGTREFRGIDLAGLDASKQRLDGVDMRRANLATTVLVNASLIGANLEGADLRAADLSGANLTGARLAGAMFNNDTTWPDGFDPIKSGALPYD